MDETTGEQTILQIDSLSVSFPGSKAGGRRLVAADKVKMSVYPRQTLAVVGESGSGKSVTALSILQLIPTPPGSYDNGRILWRADPPAVGTAAAAGSGSAAGNGRFVDILSLSDKQMRGVRGNQIAMIFQEPMTSLNPVYTVGEQILEAILLHQQVGRARAVAIAAQALEDVGIAEPAQRLREYPHQLSGGMRQRVMIAMALACQPQLLLADEPTTALDVTIQAQILDLLRKLQVEKGMAIMLITHDLGVVAENADVVAVMFAGRILEFASVYDLFGRPLHPYTRGLLRSMPVLGEQVERLPTVDDGATIPEDFPAGYRVAPHDPDAQLTGRYGGPDAALHKVEPGHWVLCERIGSEAGAEMAPPRLAFRRAEAAPSE